MERIHALRRNRKSKVMGALLMVSIALIVAIGSGANYTATEASVGNVVSAGSFALNTDLNGCTFTATLTINESKSGSCALENIGSKPGKFYIDVAKTGGSNSTVNPAITDDIFAKNIRVYIYDTTGTGPGYAAGPTNTNTPVYLMAGHSLDWLNQNLGTENPLAAPQIYGYLPGSNPTPPYPWNGGEGHTYSIEVKWDGAADTIAPSQGAESIPAVTNETDYDGASVVFDLNFSATAI